MKKYIIGLIDADLSRLKSFVCTCENVLEKDKGNNYWEKRLSSTKKKIEEISRYKERMLSMI